jgi:hypothetical protein
METRQGKEPGTTADGESDFKVTSAMERGTAGKSKLVGTRTGVADPMQVGPRKHNLPLGHCAQVPLGD